MTDDFSDEVSETNGDLDIKDTDIVFDCSHCGKSLAIDFRGAGLKIPCTDCGEMVDVPIPEGMELGDIDSSEAEQEQVILHLRRSLAVAEEKIHQLELEVKDLTARRETLEKIRQDQLYKFGAILERSGVVQRSMEEMGAALRKISEIAKD